MPNVRRNEETMENFFLGFHSDFLKVGVLKNNFLCFFSKTFLNIIFLENAWNPENIVYRVVMCKVVPIENFSFF